MSPPALAQRIMHHVIGDLIAAVLADPPARAMRRAQLAGVAGMRCDVMIVRQVDDDEDDAPLSPRARLPTQVQIGL
jgi:hypothetical protein